MFGYIFKASTHLSSLEEECQQSGKKDQRWRTTLTAKKNSDMLAMA